MSTHREENTLVGAKRLLDLIATWNKSIKTHRALGEPEDSLALGNPDQPEFCVWKQDCKFRPVLRK